MLSHDARFRLAVVGYNGAPSWLAGELDFTQLVETLSDCTGYQPEYLTRKISSGARTVRPADIWEGGVPSFRIEEIKAGA